MGTPAVDANMVSRWEQGWNRPGPYYARLLCMAFELRPKHLGLPERPTIDGYSRRTFRRMTLRVPPTIHRRVLQAAQVAGLSLQDWWMRAAEARLAVGEDDAGTRANGSRSS